MARIEFDGKGLPIPQIALPPFGSDSDLPPTVMTFTEDADFSVVDYRTLGFTHFEAWCVGAAGGRGGDATSQIVYVVEEVMRPVPQSVWNLRVELAAIEDYWQQVSDWNFDPDPTRYQPPQYGRVYHAGSDATWPEDSTKLIAGFVRWLSIVEDEFHFYPGNTVPPTYWRNRGVTGITYAQAYELANTTHLMRFETVKQVLLYPTDEGIGGGGGGGGLHKVAGVLADLPDVIPIEVGKVGLDAGFGQVHQNGAWVPDYDIPVANPVPPASPLGSGSSAAAIAARETVIRTYLSNYVKSYALPRTSFSNPVKGQDGGASSFGDASKASGGEGGDPGMSWDGAKFVIDGDGGDGGIGGSLLAGGGGAGSVAEGVNGSDGSWIPETGIGRGGGGGKGGRAPTGGGGGFPGFPSTAIQHLATASGQGSYSFADTSVYGQRQFRQAWAYLSPRLGFDPVTGLATGVVTFVPVTTNELIIPGTGGGARPFPNLKYGGRGTGFSPDGVVVVRLTKIT